jgi:3-hydroxyacyl-CoA dehydrogenase, NAD binding domain
MRSSAAVVSRTAAAKAASGAARAPIAAPVALPMGHKTAPMRRWQSSAALSPQLARVGVVGGGQMGTGIAKVAAHIAARDVVVVDVDPAVLTRSTQFISKLLAKDVEKGRVGDDEKRVIEGRVVTSTDMAALDGCDIVIEVSKTGVGFLCWSPPQQLERTHTHTKPATSPTPKPPNPHFRPPRRTPI